MRLFTNISPDRVPKESYREQSAKSTFDKDMGRLANPAKICLASVRKDGSEQEELMSSDKIEWL